MQTCGEVAGGGGVGGGGWGGGGGGVGMGGVEGREGCRSIPSILARYFELHQ